MTSLNPRWLSAVEVYAFFCRFQKVIRVPVLCDCLLELSNCKVFESTNRVFLGQIIEQHMES